MEPDNEQIVTNAVVQEGTEMVAPEASYTWEASEFVHHDKPAWWYLGLFGLVVAICGVLAFMHEWLSIGVVVVMAFAIIVYTRKEPRTLQYSIDDTGVSIDGKLSAYTMFRSYNVQPEVGWQEIDLEPARRFAPRLTLLSDADSFAKIEAILARHLPRVDRDPDFIEKISRYLKF